MRYLQVNPGDQAHLGARNQPDAVQYSVDRQFRARGGQTMGIKVQDVQTKSKVFAGRS